MTRIVLSIAARVVNEPCALGRRRLVLAVTTYIALAKVIEAVLRHGRAGEKGLAKLLAPRVAWLLTIDHELP